jgi:hypothetical protein
MPEMFKVSNSPSPEDARQTEAIGHVKTLVRESLGLSPDTSVMVTELRCTEVGCPPKETVIAVLRGPGDTRQRKLPRAVTELTREDVTALCVELSKADKVGP